MIGKYKIVTLCGSVRFKEVFMQVAKRLTLDGNIVINLGCFDVVSDGKNPENLDSLKEMLNDMYKRKIDMADEIFVINVGGYIGVNTRSEIEYAKANGKFVRYLESVL